MELVRIYEEYKKISEAYLDFVEQLVSTDFAMLIPEIITGELEKGKAQFETLMEETAKVQVEGAGCEDLKDLKYLLMDSLFLANDLAYFYKINELGRFKMRYLNAKNKKDREAMMGGGPSRSGSCPL